MTEKEGKNMRIRIDNVLRVEGRAGVYFQGSLNVAQIHELTFVPVTTKSENAILRESDPKSKGEGYQRSGSIPRMGKIKDFFKEHPDCIIPPVVLSSRGRWRFNPGNGESSNFGFLEAEGLAAIIDGQHRLGALWALYVEEKKDGGNISYPTVSFMAMAELDEDKEKETFITINNEQKGVPRSFTRYLKREGSFAGQVAEFFMSSEESVFQGRVSKSSGPARDNWDLISFGAMVDCVNETYGTDFLDFLSGDFLSAGDISYEGTAMRVDPDVSEEKRAKLMEFLRLFWQQVRDKMPEFWSDMDVMPEIHQKKNMKGQGRNHFKYRLLEETGIRAMSKLAAKIMTRTWVNDLEKPSFEDVGEILEKLSRDEKVRIALTKPKGSNRDTVLSLSPDLIKSGKAGVAPIYRQLEQAFIRLRS